MNFTVCIVFVLVLLISGEYINAPSPVLTCVHIDLESKKKMIVCELIRVVKFHAEAV